MRGLVQINAFQYGFFSQLIFVRFSFQRIWITSSRNCLENFSNPFTKTEILPFLIKIENVHPKNANLLQINTEIISQSEVLPNLITVQSLEKFL